MAMSVVKFTGFVCTFLLISQSLVQASLDDVQVIHQVNNNNKNNNIVNNVKYKHVIFMHGLKGGISEFDHFQKWMDHVSSNNHKN